MTRLHKHHATVLNQFDELIALANDSAKVGAQAPEVSGWTVLHHLEHLVLTGNGLASLMQRILTETSLPSSGSPKPIGRVVLLSGFIPRGKAKAPEIVVPRELDLDTLQSRLQQVRQRFVELEPSLQKLQAAQGRLPHPMLGDFSGPQWMRFMGIHQEHHLKIIREILQKAPHGS